jgi:hypothetical protein
LHSSQSIDDFFGYAIAEVFIVGVGTHIDEWQYSDGFIGISHVLLVVHFLHFSSVLLIQLMVF